MAREHQWDFLILHIIRDIAVIAENLSFKEAKAKSKAEAKVAKAKMKAEAKEAKAKIKADKAKAKAEAEAAKEAAPTAK